MPLPDPKPETLETRKLDRALLGGAAWTAGAKWLTQLISWPSVLITARLLSPPDYGLVEMAGSYFVVTNVMAEFGIGMAVLQLRELDRRVTAQLNTISLISGILAFLISVALAPFIAAFYETPALRNLVVVSSCAFILISLEAIPLGLLQRDMDYRRLSIAESVQALITACVSVGCAYGGLGYWSLVYGPISGRLSNIALIIFWRPTAFARPRISEVKGPLRFGVEIALQRVASSVNGISDVLVIGKTMGTAPVGAYRLASNLASTPSEKIGTLVMRVTGPLFSRVQEDRAVMLRYFLIFTETLAMSTLPALIGLAVVAQQVVDLLLGHEWTSAGAPLAWLSVFMVVRTLTALNNQVVTTLRFTRFGMWMSFVNFTIMLGAFYAASRWGVAAVAASWLILSPITSLPILIKVIRNLNCTVAQYLNALLPASVGCGAMLAAIFGLRRSLTFHGWTELMLEIALGGSVYVVVLWGLYRERIMRFVRFFAEARKPIAAATAQV